MKAQQDLAHCVGRTIQAVDWVNSENVCVSFTDNTHALVSAKLEGASYDEPTATLDLCPNLFDDMLAYNGPGLVRAGVLTQAELAECIEGRQKKEAEKTLAYERRLYEHLKYKFEKDQHANLSTGGKV